MNIFNLPDLGEGLPDAEIHEWFVKEGDTVSVTNHWYPWKRQKLSSKSLPSRWHHCQMFGSPGDVIKTGHPLVGFEASTTPNVTRVPLLVILKKVMRLVKIISQLVLLHLHPVTGVAKQHQWCVCSPNS